MVHLAFICILDNRSDIVFCYPDIVNTDSFYLFDVIVYFYIFIYVLKY